MQEVGTIVITMLNGEKIIYTVNDYDKCSYERPIFTLEKQNQCIGRYHIEEVLGILIQEEEKKVVGIYDMIPGDD